MIGAEIVVDDTFCEAFNVYVPTPPVPVPNAIIVEPPDTPVPCITEPITNAPAVTAVMVNVVLAILPSPKNTVAHVNGPVVFFAFAVN